MSPDPDRLGPLLARGERADVHEWRNGGQDPLVVKIYRGHDARRAAFALGAALGVGEHPHLLRLAGFVEVRPGVVGVLLPRLATTSAAWWLAARRVISAGEAVTLLVPVLLALLHVERRRLGSGVVADAAVSLDDVLFDARGAPVVTGVRLGVGVGSGAAGVVSLEPAGAAGAAGAARRLVGEVLSVTVGGGATARATLAALCEQNADIDELLEVLFDLDDPVPLESPAPEPPVVVPPPEPPPAVAPHVLDDIVPGLHAIRSAVAASPRLDGAVRALREVRTRVWAAVGILAASAVVGLTVVAGPGPELDSAAEAPPTAGWVATLPPRPGVSEGDTGAVASPTAALLTGDDADGATRELLRLRAACLTALDAECLAGVVQAGSPLLAQDLASVEDPALLAKRPVDLTITSVVNRLGGAVLYRVRGVGTEPSTVLATRTEAGWRLRAIV